MIHFLQEKLSARNVIKQETNRLEVFFFLLTCDSRQKCFLVRTAGQQKSSILFWAFLFLKCAYNNISLSLKPNNIGSVALLSYFEKVLALSKFALLKCENEVNPIARIPWATSTTQIEIMQCWWPGESVLLGSLQFCT